MLSGSQPNYLKYKYFNKAQKPSQVTGTSSSLTGGAENDSITLENDNGSSSSWDSTEGLTTTKRTYGNHAHDLGIEDENERSNRSRTNSIEDSASTFEGNESKDLAAEEVANTSLGSNAQDIDAKTELAPTKPPQKSKHKSTSKASNPQPTPAPTLERLERRDTISDIPPPSARVLGPSSSTYNIHGLDDDSKGKSQFSWLGKSKKLPPSGNVKDGGQLVNLVNPQRTLSKELKPLVNNPDFCDVVFVLEEKPLYAHRAILSARCSKFQQMFNTMKDPKPEIQIPNISVDISLELCLELLGAATQFSLDLLKSLCERILEQSINVENVGWIFQGADRYKATRLREICLSFIVKSFDNVSKTKAFEELSRELILEVLKKR